MSKQFIEGRRANAFWKRPEDVFLVGLDPDPKLGRPHREGEHPFWQARALEPPDEKLVMSIMFRGVIDPILVDRDDETGRAECADGRRRLVAARRANTLLTQRGEDSIEVLCVPSREGRVFDAVSALETMALGNLHRKEVGPLENARIAHEMLKRHVAKERVAAHFEITTDHLESVWMPMHLAPPEIKKLVLDRAITLAEGAMLVKMKPSDREAAVSRVQKAITQTSTAVPPAPAPTKSKAKAQKARRAKVKAALGTVTVPGKRELRQALDFAQTSANNGLSRLARTQFEVAVDMLSWVLGKAKKPTLLTQD